MDGSLLGPGRIINRYALLFLIWMAGCSIKTSGSTQPLIFTAANTPQPVTQTDWGVTQSLSTPTPTLPPLPTLDPGLPAECRQFNPAIDPVYYADFSDGACDNASWSPDRSLLAYATPIQDQADEVTRQMRLYDTTSGSITSIYTSQCGILTPEWANGLLVISDTPLDLGCGFTAVYDPSSQKTLAVMEGAVRTMWNDHWNRDHTAFYAISPDDFGPVCSETITGFDTLSHQPAPAIQPISPQTNLYIVVGKPIWSEDSRTLFAVLRDGVCTGEAAADCTYSNAYILTIDFSEPAPALSRPYMDPLLDYSIHISALGEIEISSSPSVPINCMEITQQEASLEE